MLDERVGGHRDDARVRARARAGSDAHEAILVADPLTRGWIAELGRVLAPLR